MQTPLRLTFHQLPTSPALEADIRERVDELETVCDRIVSCRVSVEAPHHHQHQGLLYRVCVDIGVPGHHVVIGGTPDHDPAHVDPYVAVRDAFQAAKRRLEDHARRSRGDVKSPHVAARGRVVHLEPDLEYGRLGSDDGREIYFHRNSVIGGIERLALGSEVRFHEEQGDSGPQASTVDPVGRHGRHGAVA